MAHVTVWLVLQKLEEKIVFSLVDSKLLSQCVIYPHTGVIAQLSRLHGLRLYMAVSASPIEIIIAHKNKTNHRDL